MKTPRVLLIDDEVGFTETLKINLESNGDYEVGVVTDSMKALETALEFEPDIVVLDIVMPEKDGGDVLAEFSQDPKLKDVPVIVLTALISNDEVAPDSVADSSGQVMIAKPVTTKRLIEVIEQKLTGTI